MSAARGDEKEDKGIQTAEDSRFFGLSAGFESFSNAGKELIIQYQAKYEKDIECGGGYVKIGPKLEDPKSFGDPTPYNIMFGPDKCGDSTSKAVKKLGGPRLHQAHAPDLQLQGQECAEDAGLEGVKLPMR